jgi:Tol biopolymer transport system component
MDPDDQTRTFVPLTSGTMVSHYRIIAKIGAGGMGEVYLAEDTELNRKVALKFLPPHLCQDADCRARFKREAQAAAKLNHSNIITIHEVAEYNGRPYMVMEYLCGKTLREIIGSGDMTVQTATNLFIQICEGVNKAHQAEIIHRDIKPANIMVEPDGGVKILDFGLANLRGAEKLTKTGSTMGTAYYMSPEQIRGETIDRRSDIFSLGIVFYEMITANLPFKGEHEPAIAYSIQYAEPEPLARYKSGVSEELQKIIRKALSKDVLLRYQTVADMLVDLRLLIEHSTANRPMHFEVSKRRLRLPLVLGGAVVLAAAVATVVLLRPENRQVLPIQKQLTFYGDATLADLSSDGQTVAFARSGGVYVWDLSGGEPLHILYATSVRYTRWSPRGTELLVGAEVNAPLDWQVLVVPRFGGDPQILYRANGSSGIESGDWSPDGNRVVIQSALGAFLLIDLKSGQSARLEGNPGAGWIRDVTWVKSGDWIMYRQCTSSGCTMWAMRPDGSSKHQLPGDDCESAYWPRVGQYFYFLRTRSGAQDLERQAFDPSNGHCKGEPVTVLPGLDAHGPISISANFQKLLYARRESSSEIWLATADDKIPRQLMARPFVRGTFQAGGPSFSPDGKSLAYAIYANNESRIFTIRTDGSNQKCLAREGERCDLPEWSPNGARIAFRIWKADGFRVAVADIDGRNEQVYENTQVSDLTQSAFYWVDNETLLYHRPQNYNYHFLNLTTGAEKPFLSSDTTGWIFEPVLSPDASRYIAYWNVRNGGNQNGSDPRSLWSFTPQGVPLTQLVPGPSRGRCIGFEDNGRSVLAAIELERGYQALYRIPVEGGAAELAYNLPDIASDVAMSSDGKTFALVIPKIQSDIWLVENFDPDRRE